ncbi:hypothetical protein BH11BAC4_BH11BAC4_15510 [soil metagenome]
MHRRILSIALIGFLGIVIINWSCTKLDTTNLGSDLIPVVDNVNTFADTFFVNATQNDYLDTTIVGRTENHVLGNISIDPLFGKTTADVYLQLKPPSYPVNFGDSIEGLDSVVLCLHYKGFYGDSNVIQTLQVSQVTDPWFDTTSRIWPTLATAPVTGNIISQPTNVDIRRLSDSTSYRYIKAKYIDQIRIKLDPVFAATFFNSDTAATGGGNHAFRNDSLFRLAYKGFAVKAVGNGNALMYVNLADTSTKLEFHYRRTNNGKIDTTYQSFGFEKSAVARPSTSANHIFRDRSGSPSSLPTGDAIYLQGQPGTYASLTIPQLTGYSNRIIHRAELIIEQVPTDPFFDSVFAAPNYLYVDIKDTGSTVKYKPLYFDLNPGQTYFPDNASLFYPSMVDFGYFGGFARRRTIPSVGSIVYYNINISRYVQRMVIDHSANYELRLWPAFLMHYGQYRSYIPYNNNVALGRVKVGSGSNPNYPMRVRIVYSKIK